MEEPGGLQSMGSLELDTTERLHFHCSLSCIGEGNGNPLQCSCLENPRDGGAWWAAIYGVAQSQTWLKWLSSSSTHICSLATCTRIIQGILGAVLWLREFWWDTVRSKPKFPLEETSITTRSHLIPTSDFKNTFPADSQRDPSNQENKMPRMRSGKSNKNRNKSW